MERPHSFGGWVDLGMDLMRRHASTHGYVLPKVRETLVTEEENGKRSNEWTSAAEFEPRFRQILERCTRSWVNLHVHSIDEGVLKLVVEYISRRDESAVTVPRDKISVNFSGPEGGWPTK